MTSNTKELNYKSRAVVTSQRGRLYSHLTKLDKTEKDYKIYKAIENHYLVEALKSEGIREREDIKEIGYRCVAELKAQVETIERSLGLESSTREERPHYFSQPQQFQPMAAPIEQTPSKPEPEPEVEEEDEDDYDYESDPRYANPKKIEMSEEKEKELLEGFMNSL